MGLFGFGNSVPEATPDEVQDTLRSGGQFLDVRSPAEFQRGHPKGATNVPLGKLEAHMATLDPLRPVVCICAMGARSAGAAKMLHKQGFKVTNVKGGTVAWRRAGLDWDA